MKDYLSVDPIAGMDGREFMSLLFLYLAQKE
jgi:hypothetical protein